MKNLSKSLFVLLVAAALAGPAAAADIVIVNLDGIDEGFNDPTSAAPVGGNPGTTIGEQRLNLFERAAGIWGALLPSDVTIRVQARFNPQSCTATTAVLGSAGPIEVERDFAGAEFPGTWYHSALANKQAGIDLFPSVNDISTTFNSSIDNNDNCLQGRNWYYGFDGNEGGDVELLPVLLHELGHGLGFSSLTNLSTGGQFFGFPDLYSTFLLDNSNGLHWDEMTSGQRAASAINTGDVVWDGFASTFAAPLVLGGTPTLFVNSPGTLPGSFDVGTATFGPELTEAGITGDLVLVDDGTGTVTDACEAIQNGAAIAGNIALIDRGTCTFASKAKLAQDEGAIAVVIVNNVAGGTLTLGGTDPTITIPVVSVSLAEGNLIKAELSGGVNVTLGLDPSRLAGTDGNNRVKVYAPNPIEGGSSISHWDTSANPSLLMEPAITGGLSDEVDLTIKHFEDLGWLDERISASPGLQVARSSLGRNAPNPFNPATTISFSLERGGSVSLEVLDLQGRRVKSLVQGSLPPGPHRAEWDGRDEADAPVASGVYLYRLKTDDFEETRRMLLLK